jgi:hypothetical protein
VVEKRWKDPQSSIFQFARCRISTGDETVELFAALNLVTTGNPGPTWRGRKSFNFTSVAWLPSYKFVSCAFSNRSLIAAAARLEETLDWGPFAKLLVALLTSRTWLLESCSSMHAAVDVIIKSPTATS